MEEQFSIKTIFLGDQGVGKTSILNRFANNTFMPSYSATIGLDFVSKYIEICNRNVKLVLYDTAGQEKFKSLIPMYIRDAKVIILVYDVTVKDSVNKALTWIDDNKIINDSNVIIALVGNKIDGEGRKISFEEGQNIANERNYIFEEVSAKTGENVESLFTNKIFPEISIKFDFFNKKIKNEEKGSNNKDKIAISDPSSNLSENEGKNTGKRRCCGK